MIDGDEFFPLVVFFDPHEDELKVMQSCLFGYVLEVDWPEDALRPVGVRFGPGRAPVHYVYLGEL